MNLVRWWTVSCIFRYSEDGPGWTAAPTSPLLAVPNVTVHPSTASVPITVLLYNGPLLCGFNVTIKGLSRATRPILLLHRDIGATIISTLQAIWLELCTDSNRELITANSRNGQVIKFSDQVSACCHSSCWSQRASVHLPPTNSASAAAPSRDSAVDAGFISIAVQSGWVRLLGDDDEPATHVDEPPVVVVLFVVQRRSVVVDEKKWRLNHLAAEHGGLRRWKSTATTPQIDVLALDSSRDRPATVTLDVWQHCLAIWLVCCLVVKRKTVLFQETRKGNKRCRLRNLEIWVIDKPSSPLRDTLVALLSISGQNSSKLGLAPLFKTRPGLRPIHNSIRCIVIYCCT